MRPIAERLVKGIGSNILGQIIGITSSIILVPVFLKYWGSSVYGEWIALSAAISYFALLDFGVQTYVVNRITQAYATGRMEDLHRDLHSSLQIFLIVVSLGLVVLFCIVGLIPLKDILGLKETGKLTANLTFIFLGCNTLFVSIPMGLISGLYRATGAYSRGQMIGNLFRVLLLGLTIGIICGRFSMAVLAFCTLLFTISSATFILFELHRFRPEINIGLKMGDISFGWYLLLPSLLFLLMTIAGAINIQGTVLIVSGFLGGIAVAQFNTTRTLSNIIIQLGSMVNSAIWPEITSLESQGEQGRLRVLYKYLTKVNLFLAILAALLLHFVGPTLYLLWTGHHLNFNLLLLDIFLVQVVFMAFWNTSATILMATNNHKYYSWLYLGSSVLTVILALFFIRVWGMTGVALSGLIADIVFCFILVPKLACHLLDESFISMASVTVLPGLLIGAGIIAMGEWFKPLITTQFLFLLLFLTCLMGSYLIISYALWLNHEERTMLRQISRRIFGFVTR